MPEIVRLIATAFAALAIGASSGASQAQAPPAEPPAGQAAPPLDRADLEAWLDGLVPAALKEADIAGLVVSVVKDGEVLFQNGYGYADLGAGTPMDPAGSVVRVGSIAKAFTATAVMQLVEQGKLDLDRDVNEYLDFSIPAAFGKPITLRHLLTHSAGFEETSYKRYSPPQSLRYHARLIPERIYPPGEIPGYSNYGLTLAGYIVERVTGMPFADYVEQRVMAPLGMHRSTFRMTVPAALAPFVAKTYSLASTGEVFPPELFAELAPVDAPAAGLATTAADMTRFMVAHLDQGRVGDYQLLRPETIGLMHAPALIPIPGTQPIALGLFRTDYKGHHVIGHSGDGEGAHAEMKLLPEQRLGIFIAVNSDGAAGAFLPAAFALRARLFQRFMDRYFPVPPVPDEPTVATAAEHARLAAGEYVWSRQQKGDYQEALFLIARFALSPTIRANDDGTIETTAALTFEESGRSQTWREIGPFVWREVGGHARLYLDVRDGKVRSVWTDQAASVWISLPVPFLLSAGLNVPLLGVAALLLVLSVLLWPVAAVVRRRRARAPLANGERRADRLTRVAVVLGVAYLAGWAVAMVRDFASTVGSEPWIRVIQGIGLLCVAGAVAALWNLWLTWRGSRGLGARIGSLAAAAGLCYLAWFSFAFHLISVRLD